MNNVFYDEIDSSFEEEMPIDAVGLKLDYIKYIIDYHKTIAYMLTEGNQSHITICNWTYDYTSLNYALTRILYNIYDKKIKKEDLLFLNELFVEILKIADNEYTEYYPKFDINMPYNEFIFYIRDYLNKINSIN